MEYKGVVGRGDFYAVSSCGVVVNKLTGSVKKQTVDRDGYKRVSLYYGRQVNRLVHRLVAEAWIENKENLPVVNHKDKNRQNNHISNLEWCTVEYNNQHALAKSCKLISPNGDVFNVKNFSEFARDFNLQNSRVSDLSRGALRHYKGWRLFDESIVGQAFDFEFSPKAKNYICIDPSGERITVNNLKRFCFSKGLCNSKMVAVCKGRQKTHKGWRCVEL